MRNRLPTFPNLRHLIVMKVPVFRQDLKWIENALKACPTLGRLELHVNFSFLLDCFKHTVHCFCQYDPWIYQCI